MNVFPPNATLATVVFAWIPDSGGPLIGTTVLLIIAFLGVVPVAFGVSWVLYYFFSLPLRRLERVRYFLDLIAVGMKMGRTAENTIVSISHTEELSVGVRFHWLADYIGQGLRLGEALDNVPRMLPPQITAILKAGETIGDLGKVLPACHRIVKDGLAQLTKAQNYLVVLAFVITPLGMSILPMLTVYVFPKYMAVMRDMEMPPPKLLMALGYAAPWIIALEGIAMALLAICALFYVGGPRVIVWLEAGVPHISEWIFLHVPWRRKRMQRDFSGMLAVLLDAGVPEPKAINLAAACTTNGIFIQRAERVAKELEQGVTLLEALRQFDPDKELSWRLANAVQSQNGFAAALGGWQESLDAKAFQEEQAAAQLITTGLALFNGLVVGTAAVAAFQPLIGLVNVVILW